MQHVTLADEQIGTSSTCVELAQSARLPEPLTSFIGREKEIDEIVALLGQPQTRLLTLTGPGGVGKTRLAIAVAQAVAAGGATTIAFVPLAPVRDPSLVVSTIGTAFGLSDSGDQALADRLSTMLHSRPFLLVVDNFEHLVEAAPLTSLLLSRCPSLKVLATSRRSLRVAAEIAFPVPALGFSHADDSPERIQASASFRLFVDRAAAISDLSQQAATIGDICSRLDGLPLAIELAAARTRVLSPPELLARLEQPLPLLTDGPVDAPVRLRTMRDAFAWSYDLLTDEEQYLLRQISIFSGGFTLDAVEAVAPEGLQTPALDLLTRLIDYSLVRRLQTEAGSTRFTMLETIREFALDALKALDEETDARDRHLDWLIACLGSPGPEDWSQLRGPAGFALHGDHDNLRAALKWALQQGDAGRATQIAWGLLPFWWRYGLNLEGGKSLQEIVDQAGTLESSVLACMLCRVAEFAHTYGDDQRSHTAASRALELCRDTAPPTVIHNALFSMGLCTRLRDPSASVDWMSQAAEISRASEDERRLAMDLVGRAWANVVLGAAKAVLADTAEALPIFERYQGQDELRQDHALALVAAAWALGFLGLIDQADDFATRALATSREFDIRNGLRASRLVLGEIALKRGDHQLAAEHMRPWLTFFHQGGLKSYGTFGFAAIAMLAQATGNWHCAARLSGFADAFWTRSQFPESAWLAATWNFDTTPTRLAIGDAEFATQFDAGGRLTDVEAVAEASSFIIAVQQRLAKHSVLTRRESEVLEHIALGQTNQEIAAELFVGKSTIDTHVASILAKLGVETRWKAVNVARERGLLQVESR